MAAGEGRELSIVVAAWSGPVELDRCLRALLAEVRPGNDEIIVARNFTLALPLPAQARDVAAPGGTIVPRLREAGLRAASGRIVVFIEDHAAPRRGWRDAIVGAFAPGVIAAGGPVDAPEAATALADAIYLYDYARFAPPLPSGPAERVSGANMAFERAALLEMLGSQGQGVYEAEVESTMRGRGQRFAFAAGATVEVIRDESTARATALAFHLARGFGATRSRAEGLWRGVIRLVAFPLVALLLFARTSAAAWRTGRWRWRLFGAAAWLLVLEGAWALGEGVGAVAGAGAAGEKWH